MASYAKAIKHKLLTKEDEVLLAQQMESDDEGIANKAREKLIVNNFRLAMSIAQKYRHTNLSMEDIIQESNVGLIKAVDRFDWRKGFRFSTYAVWWIKQSIRNYVSKSSSHLKFPSNSRILIYKINKFKKEYQEEFNVSPSISEISEFVNESEKTVKSLIDGMRYPVRLDSFFDSSKSSNSSGASRRVYEVIEDEDMINPESLIDQAMLVNLIKEALVKLTPQEEKVLRLRFGILENENDIENYPTDKFKGGK